MRDTFVLDSLTITLSDPPAQVTHLFSGGDQFRDEHRLHISEFIQLSHVLRGLSFIGVMNHIKIIFFATRGCHEAAYRASGGSGAFNHTADRLCKVGSVLIEG